MITFTDTFTYCREFDAPADVTVTVPVNIAGDGSVVLLIEIVKTPGPTPEFGLIDMKFGVALKAQLNPGGAMT